MNKIILCRVLAFVIAMGAVQPQAFACTVEGKNEKGLVASPLTTVFGCFLFPGHRHRARPRDDLAQDTLTVDDGVDVTAASAFGVY